MLHRNISFKEICKIVPILLVLFLSINPAVTAFDGGAFLNPEEDIPIEVQADQIEYLQNKSQMIGKENVVLTYKLPVEQFQLNLTTSPRFVLSIALLILLSS